MHNELKDETRLTSPRILPNPLLAAYPSLGLSVKVRVHQIVMTATLGEKHTLLQVGVCVKLCVLANVCAFVCQLLPLMICFFCIYD